MTEGRAPFPCLTLLQYIPSGSLPPSSSPIGPFSSVLSRHLSVHTQSGPVRPFVAIFPVMPAEEREREKKEGVSDRFGQGFCSLSFFLSGPNSTTCLPQPNTECVRSLAHSPGVRSLRK